MNESAVLKELEAIHRTLDEALELFTEAMKVGKELIDRAGVGDDYARYRDDTGSTRIAHR